MRATFVLLALSLPLFALPPDAAALKAKRDAKIAEVNKTYADELAKLQKRAMADGNLAGANEVAAEIARVAPTSLKDSLVAQKWNYSVPDGKTTILEIRSDGTAVVADSGELFWRSWKVSDDGKLDVVFPDGGSCSWDFPKDFQGPVKGTTHAGTVRMLKPAAAE